MKKYNFDIEKKYTTWYVHPITVKAKTAEEAEQLAIKYANDELSDEELEKYVTPSWEEEIDGTLEFMTPEENGGHYTLEVLKEIDKFPRRQSIYINVEQKNKLKK